MERKGILLFSGGLDSLLAAQVLINQNIPLKAYNFMLPYEKENYNPENSAIAHYASHLNLDLTFVQCGEDYIDMLRNPAHGYGKNVNPCIDCKIFFLKKAKEILVDTDAAFIATGEVNGQRPMSQRKDMINHIEKAAGLQRMILRPLSARFFKPTIAEERGLVNREALLDIHGRSRKIQMELAEKYGFTDYATPAGGCLLTDPFYAHRTHELFEHSDRITQRDLYLLRLGRHFRITPSIKAIVARNAEETQTLLKTKSHNDTLFSTRFQGPAILVPGITELTDQQKMIVAALAARYGKPGDSDNDRLISVFEGSTEQTIIAKTVNNKEIEALKI
ncbi:MAG: hypothetical protein PF637_14470 [Spirochaetes bacterium]|jgi:tRNA-specific 2-thiouridylase|nr:hypothetical protein [Spirochaetota bacterium]